MKGFIRSFVTASLLLLCALLAPISAMAQAYPSRAVTLINPYPPGGGADVLARALARELTEIWRQPVIIESKPGGGTTIAAAFVARANPDGYTISWTTTSAFVFNSFLLKKLPYDPQKDFVPISQLALLPHVVLLNTSAPPTYL